MIDAMLKYVWKNSSHQVKHISTQVLNNKRGSFLSSDDGKIKLQLVKVHIKFLCPFGRGQFTAQLFPNYFEGKDYILILFNVI